MNVPPSVAEMRDQLAAGAIKPVVLNLWPTCQGYSVAFPGQNCADATTAPFSYAEFELLECFERREVPWFLVDLLAAAPQPLFHKGCIAVEVNDRRLERAVKAEADSAPTRRPLIVLRPTMLSLLADLNGLLAACGQLSVEARRAFEADFWRRVSPPLCLQRPPTTALPPLEHIPITPTSDSPRRILRRKRENEVDLAKLSDLLVSKCGRVDESALDGDARLLALLKESSRALKCAEKGGGQWRPMMPATKTPSQIAERKWQAYEQKRRERYPQSAATGGANELELVERITVEMPANDALLPDLVHTTRIEMSRRRRDASYWGRLTLEGSPPVTSGPFRLGQEWDAKMYCMQYIEMITEGGRKQPVAVLRQSPGKQAVPVAACKPAPLPSAYQPQLHPLPL